MLAILWKDLRIELRTKESVPAMTLFALTVYVLFQVWNMINCRSLTPDVSGLRRVWQNRAFLGIMTAIVIGQFLIVSLGGRIFSVEPLGVIDWILIVLATSSVLVFVELARRLRRGAKPQVG